MRRSLGRFDITCLGLNAIVGSGIFMLPDDLYRELGVYSPLAFLCCAVGLLPVAACYAEAAATRDKSGGPYVYATEQFGPRVGFGVGWMCFVNSVFSFAAVAAAAAAYAARLCPPLGQAGVQKLVAVGIIGLFAALNYRGAKPGALAVDVFTLGKFLVLFILISALLPRLNLAHLSGALPLAPAGPELGPSPLGEHGLFPAALSHLGTATFIALFAAQGFEIVPVPAGEARFPRRDVPFAVIGSLIVASLLYLTVQFVLVGSGANLALVSDAPLADAALQVAPTLGLVIAIGGLISTLGFVSGSALGTPRYLYAAAVEGQLPRKLAATHPRHESPHVAVAATAALVIACVVPFDYRALIGMSNVAVAVQYLATCLAVIKLRGGRTRGWRAVVPWLGVAVSLWIFTEASRTELIWAGASLAVGAVVVWLTNYGGRKPITEP
jgi:APA family basic amino acid/polyamine antiporter